ncbi:MAG: hypothetical protein KDC79_15535 [Cyclobacteriaceae bacterium]|nr:hypothetical protein [Cyclobacteriaceae bacterium]
MKTFKRTLIWIAILPLVFVISCKDNDPAPADDNYSKMTEYMVANDLDLDNILDAWIVGAPASEADVATFAGAYHIMDIRSADAFNTGHIDGAVNSSLATIVADAAGVTKPILVVCYTGQTAAHATVALRLSGHADAKVLKNGMSGWRADLATPWESGVGNVAVGNANWVKTATAELTDHSSPEFTTTSTDPAEMLVERVAYMTNKGFQGITATDVLADPSAYFINNYWAQADVDLYGHIATAARINPLTLANDEFRYYDPAQTVVTYCWTGQTSSMVTAYLTVLGYEAKSLKFGVNSMIYDELQSHKFAQPTVDLPVVTD